MGSKSSLSMPAGRRGMKTILHVVSCYAPTRAASRQVKDTFFQDLESILAALPIGQKYVILGDFNAHVGSRKCIGDRWGSVRGQHGYGVINDADKDLLSLLSETSWISLNKCLINFIQMYHPTLPEWYSFLCYSRSSSKKEIPTVYSAW